MPWTAADAEEHTKKADTPAKRKTWAKVANAALKRCLAQSRGQEECEASAIKQANAVVANIKEYDMAYRGYFTSGSATVEVRAIDLDGEAVPVAELVAAYEEQRGEGQGQGGPRQGDGGADVCVCPKCGREVEHEKGTPCNETECPECGAAMVGKQEEMSEAVWTTAFVNDLPDSSFAVIMPGGEKDDEGKTKPRSLRKLPYKDADGKVDIPHLRNALARLAQPKTDIPANLKAKALKKLQAAAKKHLKTHQEETGEVDIGRVRDLLQEALVMLDAPAEMEEAQLSESAAGHVVELAREDTGIKPRDPLLMKVALINPGFGNKKDRHYYSPEVLKRDAHVFEGVKMYATDHRPEEKNVRTEVAVIKACPVAFTDDGAPIAQVAVHDGDFAEQARNRAKLGTLGTLECSILALGRTKKGKVDGQEANIVEAITKGQSVDWVTKAGAGGHALNLAENDTGGVNMLDKQEIERLLSESGLPQDVQERLAGAEYEDEETVKEAILKEQAQQQQAPQTLAEADVGKAVDATKLPDFTKAALKARQYKDEAELKEAVESATREVAKLTGSGQPFGQGGSEAAGDKSLSERERIIEFNKIMDAVGGRQVPVPAEQ